MKFNFILSFIFSFLSLSFLNGQISCVVNTATDVGNYPSLSESSGGTNTWGAFSLTDNVVSLKEAAFLLSTDQCPANTITFDPTLDGDTINVTSRAVMFENSGANTKIVDASNVPNLKIVGSGKTVDYNSEAVISVSGDNLELKGLNVANGDEFGLVMKNSSNVTISNSIFENNGLNQNVSNWPGIASGGYNSGYVNSNIKSISYAGILIESSNEFLLDGISSINNNGHGIKILNNGTGSDSNGDSYKGIITNSNIGISNDVAAGNFGDGILIENATNILIDNNNVAANGNRSAWDTAPGDIGEDMNSGLDNNNFYGAGIELQKGGYHTVINNFVGTNSTGTSVANGLGNHKHGIYIRGSINNKIGTVGNGNIVGGNGFAFSDVHTNDSDAPGTASRNIYYGVGHGIQIHDNLNSSRNNYIYGNYIGYYNGNCIGNAQDGISILGYENGSTGNFIGGSVAGQGNVIAGSKFGIVAQGANAGPNTIKGNFLGTDGPTITDIACPLKEGGMVFQGGSKGNVVGGEGAGEGNVIAYTKGEAITVKDNGSIENEILGNIMSCNDGGIKLEANGNNNYGVTPLMVVVNTLGSTEDLITGFTPSDDDRIDVYRAELCTDGALPCQAPGGDSEKAQGYEFVTTIAPTENTEFSTVDEKGYFELDLTSSTAVAGGLTHDNVIFVARDTENNTSEFHKCVAVLACDSLSSPVITQTTPDSLCEGQENVEFEVSGRAGSSYSWSITPSLAGWPKPGTTVTVPKVTTDFSLTVTESTVGPTCTLDTILDVIVHEAPKALTFVGDTVVCFGEDITLSLAGAATTSTFTWTPKLNISSANADSTEVTFTFTATGDYTVSVEETNEKGCTSIDGLSTKEITINEIPDAPVITGSDLVGVCEDSTATFTSALKAGFVYNWVVSSPDVITEDNGNSIVVAPAETGERTVELSVSSKGCVSDASIEKYNVEVKPTTPVIVASEAFCEGEEADFDLSTSNPQSTYCWELIGLSDATSTAILCEGVDSIRLELGKEGGQVRVTETTLLGCKSNSSDLANVTIQLNLGDVTKNSIGQICSGESYDSLAQFEIDVEHATNLTYYTEPSTPGVETGTGTSRKYDVVFPESLEGQDVVVYVIAESTIGAKQCDRDSIAWEVGVRSSEDISVDFDVKDLCDKETAIFKAYFNPGTDDNATFDWFVNGEFEESGKEFSKLGLKDEDEVEVRYNHSDDVCVHISNSREIQTHKITVLELVDLVVDGSLLLNNGVTYLEEDFNGYSVYQSSSRVDVEVEAKLGAYNSSIIYNYEISYLSETNDTVKVTDGQFPSESVTASSSTSDLSDGETERWYIIKASIEGKCPQMAEDKVKITIKYIVDVPDLVCPSCDPGENKKWVVTNLNQFPENTVVIFNRWGSIVKTYGPGEYDEHEGWDGTNDKGEQLPAGTYFFTIDFGNGAPSCQGPIALI